MCTNATLNTNNYVLRKSSYKSVQCSPGNMYIVKILTILFFTDKLSDPNVGQTVPQPTCNWVGTPQPMATLQCSQVM